MDRHAKAVARAWETAHHLLNDDIALLDHPERRCPVEIKKELRVIRLPYYSFDRKFHIGQLVVHCDLEKSVTEIFEALARCKFPISSIVPIVAYDWDDELSMLANNTSAYNYRTIAGTDKLSCHAFGRAIDINPLFNPCKQKDGSVSPSGAMYDPRRPGTITRKGMVARLFREYAFDCGVEWDDPFDPQHFELPLAA